jgi:ketosteroid isomerase-like protein
MISRERWPPVDRRREILAGMSQRDVEVLRRMFELFSERTPDWEAIFELVDPNIVWEVRRDFPDAGIYTGYEGMRRLSAAFDEAVQETWYLPLEYLDVAGHVVVPLRWGGLGIGSGATFAEREETWVFTLRHGKVRHVREYATKKEAIEAAAVPE